eukprot:1339295-Amorphochlora_amoeboformis.AAC.3
MKFTSGCVGPESSMAGKAAACAGCPNQVMAFAPIISRVVFAVRLHPTLHGVLNQYLNKNIIPIMLPSSKSALNCKNCASGKGSVDPAAAEVARSFGMVKHTILVLSGKGHLLLFFCNGWSGFKCGPFRRCGEEYCG